MAETNLTKVITLKSLTTDEILSLNGPDEFTVGLTADERLTTCGRWSQDNNICLSLFNLTIWKSEGCTVTPSSKDLPCIVGDDYIYSETNLEPGFKIEIGDKIIEFIDGPLPKRRQLPPTPGVHIQTTPPSKPTRTSPDNEISVEKASPGVDKVEDGGGSADLGEWNLLHLPTMEEELINQLHTPEQIANLSASYLNRQIHLHTDTKLNPFLVDQVFKTFQDVAVHRRDILEKFLRDFSQELVKTPEEEKGKAFHTPVIAVLVEILKQFLDPSSHVSICLQLLRSISHIGANLYPMINHQTTAAVLGSMTAYLNIINIQQYGLDILVKIATYRPDPLEKPPLHEGGIEVISLSIQHHSKNVTIVQSGCRVLTNLSNTLFDTASQIIDDGYECTDDILECVERYIVILDTISWSCTSIIQEAMRNFSSDLNVKVEGRKFLYVFARLTQLKQRKSQWYEQSLEKALNKQLDDKEQGEATEGILKRTGSFDYLRSPERKVKFDVEEEFLSSSASSAIETSVEDSGSIEISSRIFYNPHSGKPLNGDVDSVNYNSVGVNGDVDYLNDGDKVNQIMSECKQDRKRARIFCETPPIVFDKLSKSDIKLLTKLLKSVIVSGVCCQAFEGEEPKALKLLEQPMKNILRKDEVYDWLIEFVRSQYKEEITLMDFDPTTAVSLIDAVRYRSVAYELIQGLIKSVVRMFDKNTDCSILKLSCHIVIKLLHTDSLKPALHDGVFYEDLKKYLLSAVSKVRPGSPIDDVIAHVLKLNIQLQNLSMPI